MKRNNPDLHPYRWGPLVGRAYREGLDALAAAGGGRMASPSHQGLSLRVTRSYGYGNRLHN